MSDVSINVHRGGDAVLRNVFVVAGTRLAVHRIDAGNGDPLITPGNVSVSGRNSVTEKLRGTRAVEMPSWGRITVFDH